MNYLKITIYLYLAVAILFIVDGVMRINAGESPYLSFGIAAVAVFMFFFRRWWFQKKMQGYRKDNQE